MDVDKTIINIINMQSYLDVIDRENQYLFVIGCNEISCIYRGSQLQL